MDFSNCLFIFIFFPISCVLFYLTPKKFKKCSLLLISLIFLAISSWKSLIVILASTLLSYVIGLMIEKYHKKSILVLGITLNVLLLVFFKYINFIFANINEIFSTQIKSLKLMLPLGISFFTFQIISYLVDVYKKKINAEKNIIKYLLYICFFPRVLQGPIVRYEEFKKNIDEYKTPNLEETVNGLKRICFGLGKVVILSNTMGNIWNEIYSANVSALTAWLGIICYSLYLYLNFSGYIDISLGIGRIFGIQLPENFNYPYVSSSISEFWRRWHISLSSWFKDYVYIPLGGNRVGKAKHIRNIVVVWLLTGIWHGASWNFVIWGAMFGGILLIEKFFLGKYLEKAPNFIKRLYVLFIVMVSFIIFNANNMGEAITNIAGLFGANGESFINKFTIYNLRSYAIILIIGIIGATPIPKNFIQKLQQKPKTKRAINLLEPVYIAVLLIVVTAYLVDNSYNPFLYFRF